MKTNTTQQANESAAAGFTPGPWKVLGEPAVDFRHDNPFAPSRFIATADAQWDNESEGNLESGSLICAMRDGPPDNAALIAAAPQLYAALELIHSNAGESPEWIRARIEPALAAAQGKGGAA